jgi:DNA-binding HxlR family transcriptional regulator
MIVSVIAVKRRPKQSDKRKAQAVGSKHSRALTPGRLAQAITGDAWTLHILRHAFAGARRYSAFRDRLRGEGMPIPELVLADRLRRLVTLSVLDRRAGVAETSHREYWLTERGLELWTILIAIRDWEGQYAVSRRGRASDKIIHTRCGHAIHPVLSCGRCGVSITARDTEVDESGPVALATPPAAVPNYRRSNAANRGSGARFLRTQALQILGDRWSNTLCGALFLGLHGFDELRSFLSIPPAILANRLAKFVALGILRREPHAQGPRRRFYRLTDKGLALFPVVFFTVDWGNRWLAAHPEDFRVIHMRCGVAFRPAFRCSHCGETLDWRDIRPVP